MQVRQRITILGCGSSPGVPRITGDWGACDPDNPKNRRRRAALLIEQTGQDGGKTTVAIDTGPDFREQMISAKVRRLDGVVYTHRHADHLHGIDDLRGFVLEQRKRIPVHADGPTMQHMREAFAYCFVMPEGSNYPPILDAHIIGNLDDPITIHGEGGAVTLLPCQQIHGDIVSLGFRIGNIAYCSDVSDFPDTAIPRLQNLDVLIIDALQYRRHPSHLSLEQALGWIEQLQPKRALLTHMHIPLDYQTVLNETPAHVEPAYDMLVLDQSVELPLRA
ncbi:MAG: MBL fold metallo-hydrolase [Rhizobiaceae bacterium]|nr:MBL fold metallo-hydrolase [Rhizobiaceae bacterium]